MAVTGLMVRTGFGREIFPQICHLVQTVETELDTQLASKRCHMWS